jgi:hypothetical protein
MKIQHASSLRRIGLALIALAATSASAFMGWGLIIGHGAEALQVATLAALPAALGALLVQLGATRSV